MASRNNNSLVARIAGNLLSGCPPDRWLYENRDLMVESAVETARAIVAETERTEPRAATAAARQATADARGE